MGPNACWMWMGSNLGPDVAYGRVRFNGKNMQSHRAVYEILVGPVPNHLDLDHICMNRLCCNPAHLEPVTRSVNMKRAWAARKSRLEYSKRC